jgi:hypothetical protein
MGLSIYISVCSSKPQIEVDFESEDCIDDETLFYWRNDYNLQLHMEVLYFLKGGKADSFNNVNIELNLEDLEVLEEHILFSDLEINSEDDNGSDEYYNFFEMARKLISEGKYIYYSSAW